MNDTSQRMTKNEKRQNAREQARIAREQEKRREKRNRLFLQGGIVFAVIAVLAIVGIVLMQTLKPAGPGPENMATGGAIFGENLEVVASPALKADAKREAPEVNRDELPIDISVYVDYMCPGCGNFEQTYGQILENYVGSGDVQLRIFPLNFLDSQSAGTKYSTRAANAFGCMVEQQPNTAFAFHNALLSAEVQPAEGTAALTDEELLAQVEATGGNVNPELKRCVTDRRFASFFTQNTKSATETGLLGLEDGALIMNPDGSTQAEDQPQRLSSTPLVIVNGVQWVAERDGDLESYILKIKGEIEQKAGNGSEADAEAESEADAEAETDKKPEEPAKPETEPEEPAVKPEDE